MTSAMRQAQIQQHNANTHNIDARLQHLTACPPSQVMKGFTEDTKAALHLIDQYNLKRIAR